jgi:dynein heavy chain
MATTSKEGSRRFIMTDQEVKKEDFLEYINMLLSTGEIPGLLQKDDREIWLGDIT